MIQATSLEAWRVLQPQLGRVQKVVYDMIGRYPGCSNHDISRILGKGINCVTPRVKELRDMGLVVQCGCKVDDVTRKRVMVWKVI